MSGIGDFFGKALSIGGLVSAQAQQKANANLVKKKLKQKPGDLEIPAAFQQLMQGLLGQADQLGAYQHAQNAQDFKSQFARAMNNLRQRGVSSSNLTANLSAGSRKQQSLVDAQINENILGQKLGLQQQIGLQGLGTSAAERNQLTGIQGGILGNLTPALMQNPMMDLAKALISSASPATKLG